MGGVDQGALEKHFIDIELNRWSVDTYWARMGVLNSVKAALPDMKGTILDVGCGRSPYKKLMMSAPSEAEKYLGLDFANPQYTAKPDLEWQGGPIPLPDNAVDFAVATEVLKHSPDPGGVLKEMCRVTAPGGSMLVTVPFLWPLHDVPYDEFRYTPFSLKRLIEQAGYRRVEVKALGGWDASLASMLGLWVRRREIGDPWRGILERIVFVIYKKLLAADRPPTEFTSNVMITGLSARAWK